MNDKTNQLIKLFGNVGAFRLGGDSIEGFEAQLTLRGIGPLRKFSDFDDPEQAVWRMVRKIEDLNNRIKAITAIE